jgi:site-specific recombinase XerD
VQQWLVWLLRHYSETYACQEYRSLQQFFRWLAAEDEIADPMARLRAPKVADKPVPFFTSVEQKVIHTMTIPMGSAEPAAPVKRSAACHPR